MDHENHELKDQKEFLLSIKPNEIVTLNINDSTTARPSIGSMASSSSDEFISLNYNNNFHLNEEEHVELVWRNVGYVINNSSNFKFMRSKCQPDFYQVIKNVSGKCQSGKLVAFLGPSGAGKTTLLECIAGIRTIGVSGQIYVTGAPRAKIAFCAQKDYHLPELTVKESLLFASRLKNYNSKLKKWNYKQHLEIVNEILEQLGLESCAEVRIAGCSGGQLKRLTIGLELVTRPNILFLDEPTSGLDSSSCLQCIRLLQKLARGISGKQISVVASIHQPSAQVLSYIDNLYILSAGGQCIYSGPTNDLMIHFKRFDLSVPMYQTPTDFAIEVASGDFGNEILEKLSYHHIEMFGQDIIKEIPSHGVSVKKIVRKTKNQSYPFLLHIWLLFLRTNLISFRQPQMTTFRMFTNLAVAGIITIVFKNKIGEANGCVSQALVNFDLTRPGGDALSNIGFIFFSLLFVILSSQMPTILTFPLEIDVFLKERTNGWYSPGAYYIAKSLTDLPFQIIFPLVYCGITYFTTYQIYDEFRFTMFMLVMILVAINSQTIGLLIGAIFAHDLSSAVYAVALVTAPLMLFTGFLIRFNEMPEYLHPFSYMTYMRYAMASSLTIIFGYDRCDQPYHDLIGIPGIGHHEPNMKKMLELVDWLTSNDLMPDAIWFMNKNFTSQFQGEKSFITHVFELKEDDLWINILALVLYMFFFRIVGYFILLWKANRRR